MRGAKFPEQTDSASLAKAIINALQGIEHNSFAVGVRCKEEDREKIKKVRQKEIVERISDSARKIIDFNSPDVFILIDFLHKKIFWEIKPVCLCGRYKKLERGIAQTIHYCMKCKGRGCSHCTNTGKTGIDSVQEVIARAAMPVFGARDNRFHGMGREDVDVRMLGNGRPFIFELLEPKKRRASLGSLMKKINSDKRIEILDLKFCEKDEIAKVKEAEHEKIYCAVVECVEDISCEEVENLAGKKLEVSQHTPLRVVKRRADLERKRSAKLIEVKFTDEKKFELKIRASSGLYIKEFVSSDSGRTKPSISELLGKECVCVQLDVLEILDK